jgi:iron complex outermembrane receptor protein
MHRHLAFLLSFTALAADEARIRGRVLDPAGVPVPGASVELFSRSLDVRRLARTGDDGGFIFERLAPGGYLVEARAPGFGAASRELAPGDPPVDLTLAIAPLSERITVTATASAAAAGDTGKAIDLLDADLLNQRAEFSLVEALRPVAGLRVQQLGGPGAFTSIQTRGLRAADTGIVIDGFRFRDAAAPQGDATGYLGDLLFASTSRVEVLRGSASSLYGTNSIGGVVNVVTDSGGGRPHGEISAEGGGLGLFRGTARASGGWREDRLRYSAGFTHLNVTRGVDGDDRVRNSTATGSLQWLLSPSMQLSARVWATDAFLTLNTSASAAPVNIPPTGIIPARVLPRDQVRRREQGLPFEWGSANVSPALNDPDSRRDASFVSPLFAFSHQAAPSFSYRLSYQGLRTSRDNPNGPLGPGFQPRFQEANRFDGSLDTAQARADWQPLRSHRLTGGWEFERERFDNLGRNQDPNPASRVFARTRIAQNSNSAFAQDQIRLFDGRLHVSLSGRYQSFDLERPSFEGGGPRYTGIALQAPPRALTGDAAVAWFFTCSSTRIRAHGGNSYRAPSLYERFGTVFFGGQFNPIGDPRLAPDRAVSIDGGVDQYLWNSRLRLSATYFYTRLQQVVGFTGQVGLNDPYGRFFGYFNTRGGLSRGVEIAAEAHPLRSMTLLGSYTSVNADERVPLMAFTLRSPRVFPHTFSLVALQRFGKRWDASFDLLAASPYLTPLFAGAGTRAFEFQGPRKADVAVAYTLPVRDTQSLRLFTRIENVANQTFYEDGFRTPGIWAVAGMKWIW